MNKTPPILAGLIIIILIASVVVAGIIFSNSLTQETDVGDTPISISFGEVDLTGYPHPLGGTIVEDFRNFLSYIITGELVDEKLIISTVATINATLYLSITATPSESRVWMWDGNWNELTFILDGTTKTAEVFAGQFTEGSANEIPVVIQFNEGGHKVLTWWCEG